MKPEVAVRRLIHSLGFRFRLHVRGLPGKPDLVFPRFGKIVEVYGCFWHRHPHCIDSHLPRTRRNYWLPKLAGNQRRDKKNLRALHKLGWKVLIVWECQTKDSGKLAKKLKRFLTA
jgi:DNA mismatch endonuclease (patch repair protein)